MIISVHQPHFLPWLGYFNKVLNSDIFVWLHSVQYRKGYYQNRALIKNTNERPLWLTLPVHVTFGDSIDSVVIADKNWKERIYKKIKNCYIKAPYFAECFPAIAEAIDDSDNLDLVNFSAFKSILNLMRVDNVKIVRVGSIPLTTSDTTGRLVEICNYFHADCYIAGRRGKNYMRLEDFSEKGIKIFWQDFDPSQATYPQLGNTFLPALSIIDCIFNIGPEKTRELAENLWKPREVK